MKNSNAAANKMTEAAEKEGYGGQKRRRRRRRGRKNEDENNKTEKPENPSDVKPEEQQARPEDQVVKVEQPLPSQWTIGLVKDAVLVEAKLNRSPLRSKQGDREIRDDTPSVCYMGWMVCPGGGRGGVDRGATSLPRGPQPIVVCPSVPPGGGGTGAERRR